MVSVEKLTKPTSIYKISSHTNWVYSLLILQDGRLASCSKDGSIKIFTLFDSSFSCDITIPDAHESNVVNYINQLPDGTLVSCGGDKSIKMWNLSKTSVELKAVLEGHSDYVYKVIPLSQNRIGSCAADQTIIIWNGSAPYKEIKTLRGHTNWVNSILQLNNREIIVSGSYYDKSIKFWNIQNYLNIVQKVGDVFCSPSPNAICQLNDELIAVGNYGLIYFVDAVNHVKVKELKDDVLNGIYVEALLCVGKNLCCGCSKGLFWIVSYENGTTVFKEQQGDDNNNNTIRSVVKDNDGYFACYTLDNHIQVLTQ
jgi:WD40 repeat protein